MLIYGDPGAGKTRLIGTHEGSTLILRPPTDHTDSILPTSQAEEWVMSDWHDLTEAHEYLRHAEKDEIPGGSGSIASP